MQQASLFPHFQGSAGAQLHETPQVMRTEERSSSSQGCKADTALGEVTALMMRQLRHAAFVRVTHICVIDECESDRSMTTS